MNFKVYAVFDKAVSAYLPPFYARADGEASRSFAEACKDRNQFAAHVDDYTLFVIGVFDDSTGRFTNVPDAPMRLISGQEVRAADQQRFDDSKVQ